MNTNIKLDRELLRSAGLGDLDAQTADQLLRVVVDRLESAVGSALAGEMTEHQLDEFEALMLANDEAEALRWLEHNRPDYKTVVRCTYETVTRQLREEAPAILAAYQEQTRAVS